MLRSLFSVLLGFMLLFAVFPASAQEYTGDYFDIAVSGNKNSWGMTTNGTYIWITDFVDAEVYKYQMDGTYVDSFDTASSGNAYPAGITQDGTYFWIVDIADHEVYKYLADGTYTGDHFDTAACGNRQPRVITQDGTHFWITNAAYPYEVYKYSMDGTYLDSWGTVEYPARPRNDYPWGITLAGTHIWIADPAAGSVFRYSKDGVFVDSFDISVGKRSFSRGITTDGTYFWVANTSDDVVYTYLAMSENSGNPAQPELIKPVENQPCFEWTGTADNFRLLVDNDFDFSSPAENRVLIENYYQIPVENALEENEIYYWKVVARNEMGENASDVWIYVVGEVGEEPSAILGVRPVTVGVVAAIITGATMAVLMSKREEKEGT